MLFVGGDFNNKSLAPLTTAFAELIPLKAGATRKGAHLDEIYSNVANRAVDKVILKPLEKEDGTVSDHSIVAASFLLPKQRKSTVIEFKFRPITEDGTEKFGKELLGYDWTKIEKETLSLSAEALNTTLEQMVEFSFPERTRRLRSSDAPWITRKIKKMIARRKRVYRSEGKSQKYKLIKKECDIAILEAKKRFLEGIMEKVHSTRNSKPYYQAVNYLKTKEAPVKWLVQSMFPGLSDCEISEIVADFFNKISQEYDPLPDPCRHICKEDFTKYVEEYEVSARLKTFKKPKSQVKGDINPSLVNKFHDILAIPLSIIFNQTLNMLHWPQLWKNETVTVIPKNSSPASVSDLRNLSCTPLFSKVLVVYTWKAALRD